MIHAASRKSLDAVRQHIEAAGPQLDDAPAVADALFAVTELLVGHPSLRRTLAEGSTEVDDRAGLVQRLFQAKIPADALQVLIVVVNERWSSPWDLVDGIENAGNQLLLIAAERDGTLDDVEDELFRFSRIIGGDPDLRRALDDRGQPPARRAELARGLLAGKASPVTVALIAQGVRSTGHPSADLALDDLLEITAARRQRSVATVRSAVALNDTQLDRLAAALSTLYGRGIEVRVDVDPAVKGGLVVRVGDEIIDGSVVGRLAAARSGLGGE